MFILYVPVSVNFIGWTRFSGRLCIYMLFIITIIYWNVLCIDADYNSSMIIVLSDIVCVLCSCTCLFRTSPISISCHCYYQYQTHLHIVFFLTRCMIIYKSWAMIKCRRQSLKQHPGSHLYLILSVVEFVSLYWLVIESYFIYANNRDLEYRNWKM